MKDRLESRGAGEISILQKLGSVVDEKALFGMVGNVSKAHRRYRDFWHARRGPIPR